MSQIYLLPKLVIAGVAGLIGAISIQNQSNAMTIYGFAKLEWEARVWFNNNPVFFDASTETTANLNGQNQGDINDYNRDGFSDAEQSYLSDTPNNPPSPGENRFNPRYGNFQMPGLLAGPAGPDFSRGDAIACDTNILPNCFDNFPTFDEDIAAANVAELYIKSEDDGVVESGDSLGKWDMLAGFTAQNVNDRLDIDVEFLYELAVGIEGFDKDLEEAKNVKASVQWALIVVNDISGQLVGQILFTPDELKLENENGAKKDPESGNIKNEALSLVFGGIDGKPLGDYLIAITGSEMVMGSSLNNKVPRRMERDENKKGHGDLKQSTLGTVSFDGIDQLSFSDILIDTVLLDGGIPSLGDPLEGGEFLIDNTSLLGFIPDGQGWFFDDTTYQVLVGGIPVLTADVVNNFLYVGGGAHPEYDSEFQGILDNIVINNVINSPYLDALQADIDAGEPRLLSVFSEILSNTQNLTTPGSSEAIVWDDGKKVPEPSSIFSIFAIGGLGLMALQNKRQ